MPEIEYAALPGDGCNVQARRIPDDAPPFVHLLIEEVEAAKRENRAADPSKWRGSFDKTYAKMPADQREELHRRWFEALEKF